MKIGVNTLFYLPGEVGGSETYLLEILRVWKQEVIPHEVVLFTNRENHERMEEFEGDGWRRVCCPFRASNRVVRILREQLELPLRIRNAGVDVLWSPGYTMPFWVPCRQVVSLLDMQYKRFPQDLGFVARWTTEVLVQMAARRADHILTISEFSKREILELTPANADHITVTPLAADPAFSVPVAGEAEVPKPYLLCVANSYPHKNVDQLIRAFTELEEAIPHTLVWIGKPRLGEGAVQKALSGLRNPKRVVRLSGLRRSELIRLYQQADLFVFPSLYEGFGLPVLESFLAGAPIVANPCGSITEVGGGVIEFVTCISDAGWAETITRVLTWPSEERRSRVNAGFNRAAGFHWESCAGMTIAVLEKKMPSAEKKGY